MRLRLFFKALVTISAIGTLLAGVSSPAWADDTGKAEPLALRKIMQDMGKNMQLISDGISREEWEIVARLAPLIADHPQPPMAEKMRILSFVGADAGKFKRHDEKTHEAAQALERSAVRRDGYSVIASFATLQNSCLACHQGFRKPFVEHFHGPR